MLSIFGTMNHKTIKCLSDFTTLRVRYKRYILIFFSYREIYYTNYNEVICVLMSNFISTDPLNASVHILGLPPRK